MVTFWTYADESGTTLNDNQQSDQCKLECYNCQKKSILFFNQFNLILIYLFVPKMKNIVTKYIVCYSNN